MEAWQRTSWGPQWRGLLSRSQDIDLDPMWAASARNVEFYRSVIAKRLGTQYVTGWGTMALPGWDVNGGPVISATGMQAGDSVTFVAAVGMTAQVAVLLSVVGNVITLTAPLASPPAPGDGVIARRPLVDGQPVDGLFQATFRNDAQRLIAACGGQLFDVLASNVGGVSFTGAPLPQRLPATTVDVLWGGTGGGTLTTVQTIVAGDPIQIAGAGPAGGVYQGLVATVTFATRTITVTPPTTTPPAAGAAVTLFPARIQGDTYFVQFDNRTIITTSPSPAANQTTPAVYYDNSFVYQLGVKPPIEVPTLTPGGGGGAYIWRYKYRNGSTGDESEPGPQTIVGQLGSSFPLKASPDPQVTAIDIYRTTDGGQGEWYFRQSLPNVNGVFGPDNAIDQTLGILMREFLDELIPPTISVIALWPQANVLVGIDQQTGAVLFSDIPDLETGALKPASWPPANQIFVDFDDGDKPRALVPFYDSLFVGKERSVWRISGVPPDITIEPMQFRPDHSGLGMLNHKAVVIDQNTMIFPSQDGFYGLSRYPHPQGGFQSERFSRAIDNEWDRLTADIRERAHAVFLRRRRRLMTWLPVDGQPAPSDGFVFQFDGDVDTGTPHGWALWSVPPIPDGSTDPTGWVPAYTASCVATTSRHADVDRIYVGTGLGDVIQLDVGAAELGALPYLFDYATQWYTPAGKGNVIRGRALDVVLLPLTAASLVLGFGTDFTPDGTQIALALDPGSQSGFILDVSQLDVDRLGGSLNGPRQKLRAVATVLGEYHQVHFSEISGSSSFALANWTYWFQVLPPTITPGGTRLVRAGA